MASEYQMVPIGSILPSDYNPNVLDPDDLRGLVEEIKATGCLLKPIVVRRLDDGRLQTMDGDWNRAAGLFAGLGEVPVQLIEADEFEARRQTLIRNRHGKNDSLKLGYVFRDMLAARALSNRQLAEFVAVSEATVRAQLLYPQAWDLLREKAGERCSNAGQPISTEAYVWEGRIYTESVSQLETGAAAQPIADMSVRAIRKLVAALQGLADDEASEDGPSAGPSVSRILARLLRAWGMATEDERQQFCARTGIAAQTEALAKDAYTAGLYEGRTQAHAEPAPRDETKRKPDRPRKQKTNGSVSQQPEPVRDSRAADERVWLVYGGKGTLPARVLAYVAAQPDVAHTADIMHAGGCNPGEAQRVLNKKLKTAGYIRKVSYGQWRITDYGRAALSSNSEPEPVTVTQPAPEAPELRNSYAERGERIRAERCR
jgi:ParB-like chromosome segregation protein Spo0J